MNFDEPPRINHHSTEFSIVPRVLLSVNSRQSSPILVLTVPPSNAYCVTIFQNPSCNGPIIPRISQRDERQMGVPDPPQHFQSPSGRHATVPLFCLPRNRSVNETKKRQYKNKSRLDHVTRSSDGGGDRRQMWKSHADNHPSPYPLPPRTVISPYD